MKLTEKKKTYITKYVCPYCRTEYPTLTHLKQSCGKPRLIKDHFKSGDLIRRNGRRPYEVAFINAYGEVVLRKPKDYITAFGYDSRSYPGPFYSPETKFCRHSLQKVPTEEIRKLLLRREKQYKAARKLLKKDEA